MPALRTGTTAVAALLLAVLATTATTAAAGTTTRGPQRAHYCMRVDAYRITTCATAILPATPLGRQLRWVLAQLAGEAATLTEAEVRGHFSAEFFAVWGNSGPRRHWSRRSGRPSPSLAAPKAGWLCLPPPARQAVALVQSTSGYGERWRSAISSSPCRPVPWCPLTKRPSGPTGSRSARRCTHCYRALPNEVIRRSTVDPLRRNDFICGVVVTPFDEAL
jgi:hypothetical protein